MKSIVLLSMTLLAASLAPAADNSAAVIAAAQARATALLHGDAPALAAVLSDDMRCIHSTGRVETKAEAVADLAAKRVAYQKFTLLDLHTADIAPSVTVMSGKIDQRKLSKGEWSDLVLLFHAVWRNEGGHWRIVSMQTALPWAPKP
jgi:ketosteroid isomerase-like protein